MKIILPALFWACVGLSYLYVMQYMTQPWGRIYTIGLLLFGISTLLLCFLKRGMPEKEQSFNDSPPYQ